MWVQGEEKMEMIETKETGIQVRNMSRLETPSGAEWEREMITAELEDGGEEAVEVSLN